ncbi:MAG: acylneuraminate cytidylyltransferase family protein [Endomicrobiales bacterium]|nr:acylneuraminate cytidylyltransferase family protein [Endomicrobiales bacterium]
MDEKNKKVVAIIPARGGSKGIIRKNLKDIGGKPLIAHTIEHSQKAKTIDYTVLSSEDKEIQEVARSYGANVIDRPKDLAGDSARVDPLLIWTVNELEKQGIYANIIVLLYPTAPLRDVLSIDKAVTMVREEGYDSVLSLYKDDTYLWKVEGDIAAPINYEPAKRMPRQKEAWNQWAENKAVYVMTKDLLLNTGCRLGGRVGYVEMAKWRSIDLDTEDDLFLARSMYERLKP